MARLAAFALVVGLAGAQAAAQLFVHPPEYKDMEGPEATNIPFGICSADPNLRIFRYQQVHDLNLTQSLQVNRMLVRREGTDRNVWDWYTVEVDITMSTSPFRAAEAKAAFAANVGPDAVAVMPRVTLLFPPGLNLAGLPESFYYNLVHGCYRYYRVPAGRSMTWDMKIYDNTNFGRNKTDTWFDTASTALMVPTAPFGDGCQVASQASPFWGDLQLTFSVEHPIGFRLHGSCAAGPSGSSPVFVLLAAGRLLKPQTINSLACQVMLEPETLLFLGPRSLDPMGALNWSAGEPIAVLPLDPAFSGQSLFGQWAAVGTAPGERHIFLTNGTRLQLPRLWLNESPGVATIYAQGPESHTAPSGKVLRGKGMIIAVQQ